ncbi:MAG: LamG domain-containing protein, partial [Planctomycetota bacterium]
GKPIADSTHFYNNIFYADGTLSYGHGVKKLPEGRHEFAPGFGMTADPMLVEPGSGSDGLNSLEGYQLKAGSPCIGAGKRVAETGVLDFWGHPVPTAEPSIGAHEGAD